MTTCAFVPCMEAASCALEGGCLRDPKRKPAPRETVSTVKYNPMTGGRIDLEVHHEENGAAVDARWTKARAAYLKKCAAVVDNK